MKSEKDIKIFVTYKDKHKIIETDIISQSNPAAQLLMKLLKA